MPDEPGWYPDPIHPLSERYWNGSSWTGRVWTPQVSTHDVAPSSALDSGPGLSPGPDDPGLSHDRRRLTGAIFGYVLLYALFWGGVWLLFVIAPRDGGQPTILSTSIFIAFWSLPVALVVSVFVSLVAATRFGAYLTRVRHVPAVLAVVVGSAYLLVAFYLGVLLWPLALWLSERHDLFRDEDDLPSLDAFDDSGIVVGTVVAVIEWALLRRR